ncbi:unnamed protein product, partial [Didymodactylos carnosus]
LTLTMFSYLPARAADSLTPCAVFRQRSWRMLTVPTGTKSLDNYLPISIKEIGENQIKRMNSAANSLRTSEVKKSKRSLSTDGNVSTELETTVQHPPEEHPSKDVYSSCMRTNIVCPGLFRQEFQDLFEYKETSCNLKILKPKRFPGLYEETVESDFFRRKVKKLYIVIGTSDKKNR